MSDAHTTEHVTQSFADPGSYTFADATTTSADQPSEVGNPLVTVLIPAYNEALKLHGSLTAIHAYMQARSDREDFEIIVVDDGSTDETGAIAEAFASTHPEVRVIRQPSNMRIGQALRDGFSESRGDIVVSFDSDLTYDVDHIGRMIEAMRRDHLTIVLASPYMDGGQTSGIPWSREVMSKQVNRLLSATSQYPVKTVTGMVRAYNGPFIRSLSLKAMGPEINTEIMYKAQIMRARVAEIPAHLDWTDQAERMAKRKVSLRVSTTSKLLVFASFLYRPILFFILPGLILLFVSTWASVALTWTVLSQARDEAGGWYDRITSGLSSAWQIRPQTFILAGFTFIVAVQLISLGLLATQSKRYFEELYFSTIHGQERSSKELALRRSDPE